MSSDPRKTFILGRINVNTNVVEYLSFIRKTDSNNIVYNGPGASAESSKQAGRVEEYIWTTENDTNLTSNLSKNKRTPLAFTTEGNAGSSVFSYQFVDNFTFTKDDIPNNPDFVIQPRQYKIALVNTDSDIQSLSYLRRIESKYVKTVNINEATTFVFDSKNIIMGEGIDPPSGNYKFFLNGWAPNDTEVKTYVWGTIFSNCSSELFPYVCPTGNTCVRKTCVLDDEIPDPDPIEPIPDPDDPDDTDDPDDPSDDIPDDDTGVPPELDDSNLTLIIILVSCIAIFGIIMGILFFVRGDDEE